MRVSASSQSPELPTTSFQCPKPDEYVEFWRVEPFTKTPLVILNTDMLVVPTHWSEETGTFPCHAARGDCGCLKSGWQVRRQGYLGVMSHPEARKWVLPVTESAWNWCRDLQAALGDLRGRWIRPERKGRRRNSPLRVFILPKREREDLLPPPVDVAGVLHRVFYGCDPITQPRILTAE